MASKLTRQAFVLNFGVMYDCLEELACLSEDLQDRDITLPRTHSLIYRTIQVFHYMVDYPGIKYKEVKNAVEKDKKFKSVSIKENRKSDVVIPHGQFVRSLAANLQNRLVVFGDKETDISKLISSLDSLDPSKWPQDCPLTYANEEIKYLCDVFSLDDCRARTGFQEYIDPGFNGTSRKIT